jgi:hypothetical protein
MTAVVLKQNLFCQDHKTNAKIAQTGSQLEIVGLYRFHILQSQVDFK